MPSCTGPVVEAQVERGSDRAARRSGAPSLAPASAVLAPIAAPMLLLLLLATAARAKDEFPQGTITEVRVQGNVTPGW